MRHTRSAITSSTSAADRPPNGMLIWVPSTDKSVEQDAAYVQRALTALSLQLNTEAELPPNPRLLRPTLSPADQRRGDILPDRSVRPRRPPGTSQRLVRVYFGELDHKRTQAAEAGVNGAPFLPPNGLNCGLN